MSTADMQRQGAGWYYGATVADGQTGPWVYVPQAFQYEPVVVVGNPSGGASYRIEYTISPRSAIEADEAVPVPWTPGDKTTLDSQVIDARVIAVRLVNLGGDAVSWEALV
jgi:hypothetical protein